MTWTRDSTSGSLVHAGTARDFWLVHDDVPARAQITAGLAKIADKVMVCVRSSGDGRTCFEVGVDGPVLLIRQIEFGNTIATVAQETHSIAADTAYTVRVRLDANAEGYATITATAGVAGGAEVACSYTSNTNLAYTFRTGVASNVDGATVNTFEKATLQDQVVTFGEMGLAIIGGGVYRSLRDRVWEAVPGGENAFPSGVRVAMAPLNGSMFMVGGGRAKEYKPVPNTVGNWTTTSGTLPGATPDPDNPGSYLPGTTTATMIREHLGGLVLASPDDVLIKGCAIGEPYNWNTAERLYGSAYELGVGRNVTVGDTILSIDRGPGNSLFIGCTNSVNFMVGDPYAGTAEILTASQTFGVSGPDSNAVVMAGRSQTAVMLSHTPEGITICQPGSTPINITQPILGRHINYPRDQRPLYTVVMVRDPQRQQLKIFIDTPGDGAGSTHLIYDEPTGGYSPGRPGYFPATYPFRVCAAAIVRGTPLIGTTDGQLVAFDDSASDDIGTPVLSKMTLQLADQPPSDNDVILTHPRIVLGLDSSPVTMSLYGGVTAEQAYDASQRLLLAQETFVPKQHRGAISGRAPFIVAILEAGGAGERIVYETMEADITTAAMSTATGWKEPDQPTGPCSRYSPSSIPGGPPPPAPPPAPGPPPPDPSPPPDEQWYPLVADNQDPFWTNNEDPFWTNNTTAEVPSAPPPESESLPGISDQ